jgi:hypothetical protein
MVQFTGASQYDLDLDDKGETCRKSTTMTATLNTPGGRSADLCSYGDQLQSP